jgi:hypothetical protein
VASDMRLTTFSLLLPVRQKLVAITVIGRRLVRVICSLR